MGTRVISLFAAVFVLASLTACAPPPKRELSSELPDIVALPSGRNPLDEERKGAQFEGFSGALAMLEERHGRPLEVLMLSGGGSNGAFGAGVLYGWGESGRRPTFDIVTGISTGALQATFAHLGTKADDEALKEIFTTITSEDVYREGGVMRVLSGGNSLMDSAPLAQLIAKYITEDILSRVAAKWDEGRVLAIGTVNLDTNQLWIWNMGRLAKETGPGALDLYRKVVLAAASPPVAFPPVEIHGHLMADGATRDNLFVVGQMGPSTRFSDEAGRKGNVYVIHNGRPNATTGAIPADLQSILGRSLAIMMDAQMAQTLIRAYAVTTIHGYQFNMIRIPDDEPVSTDILNFDPETMSRLFKAGHRLGLEPEPWIHRPPPTQQIREWLIEAVGNIPIQRP